LKIGHTGKKALVMGAGALHKDLFAASKSQRIHWPKDALIPAALSVAA